MLHHRTKNPAIRADHIAEKAATVVRRRTNGDWEAESSTRRTVYAEVLKEFASFSLSEDIATAY